MSQTAPDSLRPSPKPALPAGSSRSFWLRQLHRWHWISSGLCLAGMLLFAITGITLNHAGDIASAPVTRQQEFKLDAGALAELQRPVADGAKKPLPAAVRHAAEQRLGISLDGTIGEWSDFDVFVAMPRPGGDATLTIDRETGQAKLETVDNGWISYFNDLHKGRNAGPAWGWFIDIFAVACLVFSITGLLLLQLHARTRPSTWPIVGLGVLLPFLLALLFIHR
ncbi:MAG: PepSY-associated TM helix domain-containing protein [Candidatus Andeanibacterium colombiense]|uniref:PepSY-associated TM helix domain-containing protein n=1 Tax=Candidatus Andeanibacterium colombiense TaxID=3121345 RepID=A0AAJ6BP02_9SPHN|nr:MAG: PepSY-associated TM helix domain-containing protein [Sphingomonadaceae bacterium]